MRVLILLCAAVLAGCDVSDPAPSLVDPDWKEAPREYVCTVDQSARVEVETKFCNENTDYFSTYCYGSAIMRNCTKRGTPDAH